MSEVSLKVPPERDFYIPLLRTLQLILFFCDVVFIVRWDLPHVFVLTVILVVLELEIMRAEGRL